ncbi:MAG TPA: alpha-L-fucosidase [Bacteroidota bacterium]
MTAHRKAGFILAFLLLILLPGSRSLLSAQVRTDSLKEADPAVLQKLEWFQDLKFGLMMHWGPYSQWGVVESWSICSEDEPWCQRTMQNYVEYCEAYEQLKDTFNPAKFNPDQWADAARYAGMKYVVFTTKHHDGFCMFDTRQTDYSITDSGCAFHANPRANITKEIFHAFRKDGFGIGAYFSKPDWHSPYYWDPYWAHADRNVNYSIEKHPDIWKKFVQFTYNQIQELMTGYGPIDILWLDGGWVNPANRNQDIDMPAIARMARSKQPGLIIVDRDVGGKYENYKTPEQQVPDRPLRYVWETCMTMGNSWSYTPDDNYKTTSQLVHLLVDIVAKGGNFLLNIGPTPEGDLPPVALKRLQEIGDWMKVNGDAIYSTRPVVPYAKDNLRFTKTEHGSVNAIYLSADSENVMPAEIHLDFLVPSENSNVYLRGYPSPLKWERFGFGVTIIVPEVARKNPPCKFAWTFVIDKPAKIIE